MTTNKYRVYLEQLTELRKQIDEDFDYYRKMNSLIDRRLNELGKRGNIEATAEEMTELLAQRRIVKDTALKLLPLRDFYRGGFDEVIERIKKVESFN